MFKAPEIDFARGGIEAASVVVRAGCSHLFQSEGSIGLKIETWLTHLEVNPVRRWLTKQNADVDLDLEVIRLIAQHVRIEWEYLPRRSAAEHKKAYQKVQKLSQLLKEALTASGAQHGIGSDVEGLWQVRLSQVLGMTHEQASETSELVRLLTIEDVLDWLDWEATRIGQRTSQHPRPAKKGADRGFFVRRMKTLLSLRYKAIPNHVLGSITSAALGVPTDETAVADYLRAQQSMG